MLPEFPVVVIVLAIAGLLVVVLKVLPLRRNGEDRGGSITMSRRMSAVEESASFSRQRATSATERHQSVPPALRARDGSQAAWVDVSSTVSAEPALFELRRVSKSYCDAGGLHVAVLRELGFAFGECVTGVLGPSGQGKSTLLGLLGGLDTPDAGEIYFRGERLAPTEGPELQRYRASQISFVFQDLNLVTHLSVVENVAMPLLLKGVPWATACRRAHPYVGAVGPGGLEQRRPHQLSGGERQRVAIARAFAGGGEVILADEPTGSLDPVTADRVMERFCELSRRCRRPIVLVSHNEDLVSRHCDRVVRCTSSGLVDVTMNFRAAGFAKLSLAQSGD